ncbi:hypothetical protein HMPREF3213_02523 [Heyndrickxia coagulans]|uniref:Uncharacterized protein n=1 Tax=Heyndrickxia coagulans TaxID=1398 RepID=A0A133KJJ2_HEYCO|nr:hypothetical protein HMPREF3213_02523 [Heyndrickxia coagulans]
MILPLCCLLPKVIHPKFVSGLDAGNCSSFYLASCLIYLVYGV